MADLARRTMAEQLALATPFVARPGLTIRLHEPPCQALVSSVGDSDGFDGAARAALGFVLPQEPNRIAGEGTIALWLAPGRWLVVADDPRTSGLAAQLGAALVAHGGFVSDVTQGLAVFHVAGPRAHDLLAMGCALEAAALAPGRCAQSNFAGMRTLIYQHTDGYRLSVDRVFARHMAQWLREAATAFV